MLVDHREPRGHNRDYYQRPIQSDRILSGYGHTKLDRDDPLPVGKLILSLLFFLSAVYAMANWS